MEKLSFVHLIIMWSKYFVCHNCRSPGSNLSHDGEARFKCECQGPHRKFKGSLATLMEEPLSTLPFYLMVLGDSPRNATLPGARKKQSKASEGFEISLVISHCDSIRLSADFASMLMNRHLNAVTNINLILVTVCAQT